MIRRTLLAWAVLAFAFSSPLLAQVSINRGQGRISGPLDAYATRYPYSRTVPNRKNVHYILPTNFSRTDTDTLFAMLNDLGMSLVRLKFKWGDIEDTNDVFNWTGISRNRRDYDYLVKTAHDYGIQLVIEYGTSPDWANGGNADSEGPPTSFATWTDFVTHLLARYKPNGTLAQSFGWAATDRVVYAIEVFNEPNNTVDGQWVVWNSGTSTFDLVSEPNRWADMVNQTITAAHAEDSGVVVLSGPLCTGCVTTDWEGYLDTALSVGLLNQPDAFGMNGFYTTVQALSEIFSDTFYSDLQLMRTKLRNNWGTAADTMGIWCMECGTANVKCGTNNQTLMANEVEYFYQQDQALDQARLDGRRKLDRMFWRILEDTATLPAASGSGYGGLVFQNITFPPVELTSTHLQCPQVGDPDCAGGSCFATSGLKKTSYDRMKISIPTIP